MAEFDHTGKPMTPRKSDDEQLEAAGGRRGGQAPLVEADFERARERLVHDHLEGRFNEISDPRVLAAMRTVPRHAFVPSNSIGMAYADQPLPIGHGQTISQPSLVALMCQELRLGPADTVLEIGTGSGYHAAVLSLLVDQVYTMEIIPELTEEAVLTFRRLRYGNIHCRVGDGHYGWPENAPYQGIIVTCAPYRVPQALVDQLTDGGRLVIPVEEFGQQSLYLLRKSDHQISREALVPVRFVPMTHG
jgi:protein-L-isoaspartate(D-aspartate) O-methyltransferase